MRPALVPGPALPRPLGLPEEHLSFSQISRYETCGEQYRLHYIERLRPRRTSAALVFGTAIHETLATHFTGGEDPISFFSAEWGLHQDDDLKYSGRDSWTSLHEKGLGLMATFLKEIRPRIGTVLGVEVSFSLAVSSLPVPLIGTIDLIAELDSIPTVIDWKTSSSSYPEHEVHLSDQLTAYGLAKPEISAVAFGVFVKTKEPRFEWEKSSRTGQNGSSLLRKVEKIASDIQAGHFDRRPGDHCGYCDFLPLCLGRMAEAETSLIVLS